jgi:hypothetical protein
MPGTPLFVYGQQLGLIGKAPQDEERYLLDVSGTGASKVNYINLNGAKKRDIVFWEWLVRLEASRTFYELKKNSPQTNSSVLTDQIATSIHKEIVGKPMGFKEILMMLRQIHRDAKRLPWKKWKFVLFYGVDYMLKKILIPAKLTHQLPRWFIYPILKNLVYLQYLVQKVTLGLYGKGYNLFSYNRRVSPLSDEKILSPRHNRSLRTVVLEKRRESQPGSLTEASQDLLAIGL